MLGRQHPEPLSERQWICRIIRDHHRLFLPTAIQENLAHTSWVRRGLHMLVFCLALKVSKTEWFLFCYIYSETLLGFDIMVFVRFWRWSRYGPGLCWLAIWADRNRKLVLNGMGWLFLAVWWVIIGIFITCELFKSKIVSFLKIFGSLVQGFNLFEMLVFFCLEKQLFRKSIWEFGQQGLISQNWPSQKVTMHLLPWRRFSPVLLKVDLHTGSPSLCLGTLCMWFMDCS